MIDMEQIDLSGVPLPPRIEDRSFDEGMVQDLITYLKNIRDNSLDYVVPGPKLAVVPHDDSKGWEMVIDTGEGMKVFQPTDWARAQTVSKTPVPKKYHDRMLEEKKAGLAALNLNEWLQDDRKHMVRTVGPHFRALVSDRYRAFDNLDLFGQVAKAVSSTNLSRQSIDINFKPVTFWKADVTETSMFTSILDRGQTYDLGAPGKPDEYNVMLTIKNSEVGKGSMSIEPSFFRGMCLNLYSREPALRKIHSGEKLEEGIFSADTRIAQKELWFREVRDVFNATILDHEFFDTWAEEFKEAKEVKISDMKVTVNKVADEFKFTELEENEILTALMTDRTIYPEDRGTGYALINAMTVASKNMQLDRSHEISRIAGDVKRVMEVVA
jgi:hypothetical protein